MTYRCSECGSTVPNDADFCFSCGADKSKLYRDDPSGTEIAYCPKCGVRVDADVGNCPQCGEPVRTLSFSRPVKNAFLALAAGIIPGFVDVHGIGHLVLGKYRRAAVFLGLSAVINLMKYMFMFGGGPAFLYYTFTFLSLTVFLVQMLDLFNIVNGGQGLRFNLPKP
jgi:DNA-directed RNA polymerase subunit RPC12/RpoP